MKAIPILAAILGCFVVAVLVVDIGPKPVAQAVATIGWLGFSAVCLIHLVMIVGMGFAWRAVMTATPSWVFVWGRLVRDAGSEILPFSQFGGLVLGARAVTLAGLPTPAAVASTIVDVTLEFVSKLAYLLLGLLWLVHLSSQSPLLLPLSISLAVSAAAATALVAVQRRGFGLLERFGSALARGWTDQLVAGAAVLRDALAQIYRRKSGLWAGFLIHLGCWIASSIEVWAALHLAGAAFDFGTVLVMESLLYGIRTIGFAIPNAVGVQEAAYVFIGAGFGLTPELALAVSFMKRARDLAIGLPTLALWQAVESRRLWRRRLGMRP